MSDSHVRRGYIILYIGSFSLHAVIPKWYIDVSLMQWNPTYEGPGGPGGGGGGGSDHWESSAIVGSCIEFKHIACYSYHPLSCTHNIY